MKTLQQEKLRLKIYCTYQEKRIGDQLQYLKHDYGQSISSNLLPYSHDTNKILGTLLDWMNALFLGKKQSGWQGTALKVAQVLLIRAVKMFAKR